MVAGAAVAAGSGVSGGFLSHDQLARPAIRISRTSNRKTFDPDDRPPGGSSLTCLFLLNKVG